VTQGHFVASLAAMCVAVIGITSIVPIFFALTSEILSKAAAAAGIALVSSLGNLGARSALRSPARSMPPPAARSTACIW
jgi:hypothetical protein